MEQWAPELRVAVNALLSSKLIACLIWGEERILLYNDLYKPLLGNKPYSLGKPFLEVWAEIREQADAITSEPLQSGIANIFERVPFWILIDGELVERVCTLTTNPIWSSSGSTPHVAGLYQTIIDHTEGVHAARALRKSEAQLQQSYAELQALYDGGAVAAALIDAKTFHYLRVNHKLAEMLERPVEKVVGTSVYDLAPNVTGLRSQLEQVAAGASLIGVTEEGELEGRPGDHRMWQSNYVPVRSADGEIMGIAAASIEITHMKRAEAALIQSEKLAAVGRLASSIAHEINNPLEAVTNLLYLMRNETTTPEQRREYLDSADRELRRVSMITNQTLRFHKQSSNPTAIYLNELVDDSLSLFHARLLNAAISIETRYRALDPVHCFDGEIRQVINNLIGNAIDAMPHGGRLLIRTRRSTCLRKGAKGMTLTVADTGHGMSASTKKKIFTPFFTTKGIGGTGLGLWVSTGIVERHHGALTVASREGEHAHGTVFRLFLPFAVSDLKDEPIR